MVTGQVFIFLPWKGIQTEDEEKCADGQENGWATKGGEGCPGVLQQPFVLARPISTGFTYMNPNIQYTPRLSEKLSVCAVI